MGACLCKDCPDGQENGNNENDEDTAVPSIDSHAAGDPSPDFKFPTSANIDKLVLETLGVIGCLVDK